jgi:hypothetical protein
MTIQAGEWIYHHQPKEMAGDRLFPLNQLKDLHPELYRSASRKYQGRESIMRWRVPLLDCFWNDVLFFTPYHPRVFSEALECVGSPISSSTRWYRFPMSAFDGLPSVWLDTRPAMQGGESPDTLRPEQVTPPRPWPVFPRDSLPEWTLSYYKDEVAQGRRPLIFNGTMHFLVKAPVPISMAELIQL